MLETESQLVELSQQGDRNAYEKLYRANVGKVYALCLRLCGQRELAEDLTQESFIRAWQKLDKFRGESAFGSWLYRLTSNVAISHLRQNNKWKMVEFSSQLHDGESNDDMTKSKTMDIERALGKLPEQARAVIILHEYLGYQHDEISNLTGMAIGTSKSHLHRARKLLTKLNSYEPANQKSNITSMHRNPPISTHE